MPTVPSKPQIVAHRGLHVEFPENSTAAFRAARDAGADWVECDVHASFDGEPVIIHDETLDRSTMATGRVGDQRIQFLAETPLRGPGAEKWMHIPLLRDRDPRENLLVEIKPPDAAALVKKVMQFRSGGAWMIQSFDEANLHHALALDPGVPVAFLVEDRESLDRGIANGWKNIHLCHDLLDEPTARRLREGGIAIGVWTVNSAPDLRRVMELGAAMIITDELELAMQIRDEI